LHGEEILNVIFENAESFSNEMKAQAICKVMS